MNRFLKQNCLYGLLLATAVAGVFGTKAEATGLCLSEYSAGVAFLLESEFTEDEYVQMASEAEGAYWGYTNLAIANVNGVAFINVYEEPATDSLAVGRMYHDAACEVLGEETVETDSLEETELAKEWLRICSGSVEGYVQKAYFITGPDAVLYVNDKFENAEDEMTQELETALSINEILYGQEVTQERAELVEYAKQFLGNPYVWGGTSLTKGADCSGFVLSIFKEYGVTLPHYSGAQAQEGKKIASSELLPGDLVFYGNNRGTINHVAIYIGNGEVIHASSPRTGIKISKYNYRTPIKCVSLLERE